MTEQNDIKTVQTSRGELCYYRDWGSNSEGGIVMVNPKTLTYYKQNRESHPNIENYACFFAFGREQFNRNLSAAISAGRIKKSDQIKYHPHYSGLYGTQEGIRAFLAWYNERDSTLPTECDPQEVYFYEYNNHECMFAWDGDLDAIKIIIEIWGENAARKIQRIDASLSIDQIIEREYKNAN